MNAGTAVQNDSMLRVGKAMSSAPIEMGIKKFPNPPTIIGMTTKKIMMVACMVNSMLYTSELTTPARMAGSQFWFSQNSSGMSPVSGNGVPGKPSCQRTVIANRPPMMSMNNPEKRN